MTGDRSRFALLVLQWVLGLVILAEAVGFAFSPASTRAFAKTGLPDFIRLALAWGEIGAAILFLIPRTIIIGSWLMIAVLACAVILHILHGWWDVGALVVYAAATWAVMIARTQPSAAN
jgi:hypothetical protein